MNEIEFVGEKLKITDHLAPIRCDCDAHLFRDLTFNENFIIAVDNNTKDIKILHNGEEKLNITFDIDKNTFTITKNDTSVGIIIKCVNMIDYIGLCKINNSNNFDLNEIDISNVECTC